MPGYRMVKKLAVKNFAIHQIFLPIFTASNTIAYGFRLPMAKHNYGLLFMVVFSLLASDVFLNELTITCNLCHKVLCHCLFRDCPIITCFK